MRGKRWACVAGATILAIGLLAQIPADPAETVRKKRPRGTAHVRPRVAQGTEPDAEEYYRSASLHLGLLDAERINESALQDLTEYCGYPATELSAQDLHDLSAPDLMRRLPNDVLGAAFFAPKIADVSGEIVPPALGWRKVVRLRIRPGSPAAARGVTALFVLFNHFQANVQESPFARESVNTQAMVIRGPVSDLQDPVYWFVYDKPSTGRGGRIKTFLDATFDSADPRLTGLIKYYVPAACADCHGGDRDAGKLNYLDTDHWYDRVQEGDDFAQLRPSPHGVLFDGGKIAADGGTAPPDARYAEAFKVLFALNQEIHEQNRAVSPSSFVTLAVSTWLKLHTDASGQPVPAHVPMLQRGLPRTTPQGIVQWTPGNPTDEALLPLLNRYCYRCHSSVRYHVFDRVAVKNRARAMISRIQTPEFQPDLTMPQDRQLPDDAKARLVELLKTLIPAPPQ
jgi:hypothetical protein